MIGFPDWLYEVDLYLRANNGGRDSTHLDAPFHDYYTNGDSPEEGARAAIIYSEVEMDSESEKVCPDCGGPTGISSHVDGCCGECVGKRLLALYE